MLSDSFFGTARKAMIESQLRCNRFSLPDIQLANQARNYLSQVGCETMSFLPATNVQELSARLKSGESLSILDVREPWETDICLIPGSLKIPLGNLLQRLQEIPRDRPLFVICHHGGRSARAVDLLLRNGYAQACNVQGGIAAWAMYIDPQMETYT